MKSKILFVVSLLFGLMMVNSGINKFLNYMPMPEVPKAAGELMYGFIQSGWLFALIAIAEIIGGVLISIPKFRALGAIIIFPVIVGIVLFNVVLAPAGIIMSVVLFAINVWIIIENRNKYLHLIIDTKH